MERILTIEESRVHGQAIIDIIIDYAGDNELTPKQIVEIVSAIQISMIKALKDTEEHYGKG
jgi:hypothetical protein